MAWVSTTGQRLDTGAEIEAFGKLARDTGMEFIPVVDAPYSDLPHALAKHRPDIFHFIGHGNSAGELILSDKIGNEHPVSTADLAASLRAAGGVEGVVLNACHSGVASHAAAPRGGWVIAMDKTIVDDAAIEFTHAFYGALTAGAPGCDSVVGPHRVGGKWPQSSTRRAVVTDLSGPTG